MAAILWAVLTLIPGNSSAAEADLYVCVATDSTGFTYDTEKKSWLSARFEPGNTFRIFKAAKGEKPYIVESKIGAMMFCNEFDRYRRLACEGFGTFQFNEQSGRFIFASTIGYVNIGPGMAFEAEEKSPPPYMQIGTCSKP